MNTLTLTEVNKILLETDCADLEAVAAVLVQRARVLAQFAAIADPETLATTLSTGEEFRGRLRLAQINAELEVEGLRRLKKGLLANSDQSFETSDQTVCFG